MKVNLKHHRMFCRSGALAANAKASKRIRAANAAPAKFHGSGWALRPCALVRHNSPENQVFENPVSNFCQLFFI